MPGFDRYRIVGSTDTELDEFTCAICLGMFNNPMVTQCCRQTYCKECIREWVSQHKTCPNDRKTLTKKGLRPVPRVMINLLENMKIKCDHEMDGCQQVIRIRDLNQHLTVCDYRPNQLCKTCGLLKESVSTHNCIEALLLEKQRTDTKYLNLLDENSLLLFERRENSQTINELKTELAHLRNDHQRALDRLKNDQAKALNQMRLNFARVFEEMRENHSMELAQIRASYSNQIRLNSDLEYDLADFKWRHTSVQLKCAQLELRNGELAEEVSEAKSKLFKLAVASFVLFVGICFSRYV